ncbi:Protein of unknown function [Gryllus bimaculatus]|nr:Protein of unknown function [Gryllus bimaculatus]
MLTRREQLLIRPWQQRRYNNHRRKRVGVYRLRAPPVPEPPPEFGTPPPGRRGRCAACNPALAARAASAPAPEDRSPTPAPTPAPSPPAPRRARTAQKFQQPAKCLMHCCKMNNEPYHTLACCFINVGEKAKTLPFSCYNFVCCLACINKLKIIHFTCNLYNPVFIFTGIKSQNIQ